MKLHGKILALRAHRLPEARHRPSSSQERLQSREATRTFPDRVVRLLLEALLLLAFKSLTLLLSLRLVASALLRLLVAFRKLLLLLVPTVSLELRRLELLPKPLLSQPGVPRISSSVHRLSSSVVPLAKTCVRGLNASACTLPE